METTVRLGRHTFQKGEESKIIFFKLMTAILIFSCSLLMHKLAIMKKEQRFL